MSAELLQVTARRAWIPLVELVVEKLTPLLSLFGSANFEVSETLKSGIPSFSEKPVAEWSGPLTVLEKGWHEVLLGYGRSQSGAIIFPDLFNFLISLEGFVSGGRPVKVKQSIHIQLEAFSWSLVAINVELPKQSFRYDESLTHETQVGLANLLVKSLLKQVEQQSESRA